MRVLAAALALLASTLGQAHAPNVLIFAASSLKTALDALAEPIRQATGVVATVSYASSAVLARQIEAGAPADLFISADTDWMDYAESRHLITPGSRVNLLGNALVLIAPAHLTQGGGTTATDERKALTIAPGFPLAAALGGGRLAVGETTSVPAGKYAKAALQRLGVWASVEGRLLPAENVRAALSLVSHGEAPLGIVYATDALADPGVGVVGTFPAGSHPAIVYPAGLVARGGAGAATVLAFLKTPAALAIFRRFGFTTPTP